MIAVSLAISVIPEGLPATVTVVMAIGVQRMAEKRALVKQLPAVETLGSATVICTDKTGTLTENKMTVTEYYTADNLLGSGENNLTDLLAYCGILCNNASIIKGEIQGDPTEGALLQFAEKNKYNIEKIIKENKKDYEKPFDSDRKLMTVICKDEKGKKTAYIKGAPEELIKKCSYALIDGKKKKITDKDKEIISTKCDYLADNALRSLGFAYKTTKLSEKEVEDDLIFLGITGMIDPPREESKQAVADCITAGIKPIMITGDHKITASAIAKEIGILRDGDRAIEGLEIDKMSDEELRENVEHISVYARVSPEHKIRIVKAWQDKGQIVAMTGDGVNDAPALKQADIGIAMGITGTEVSKDAAYVILTDDNFATIVKSVSNGRGIYNNIKNSIKFLLSGNTSGIIAVLYSSIMALPMPFAAVHLLFINLLTDSLPAISIGMEKSNRDLLKDKPRGKNESILNKDFLLGIGFEGLLIAIFTMVAFYIGNPKETPLTASTMAFATLCLARLFHGFNCRGKGSIFKLGVFSNKYVWYAFGVGLVLLNAVLFVPFLQNLFEVENLAFNQYVSIYVLAFIPTLIIQLKKVIFEFIENKKSKNNANINRSGELKDIA